MRGCPQAGAWCESAAVPADERGSGMFHGKTVLIQMSEQTFPLKHMQTVQAAVIWP